MKTKVKIIISIIFILTILGISSKVQAASASITATKTTATVGDSVTITANINAAAWNLKVTGNGISGGNIVGYDPDGNNTSTTRTYTLSTSTAGTYTIYLTGDVTDGATDATNDISTSVKIKVENPAPVTPTTSNNGNNTSGSTTSKPSTGDKINSGSTASKPSTTSKPIEEKKSNDATLKSLVVEGYEIYPAFDPVARVYNLRVTNDITKVTVIPTVNNAKANYQIQGIDEELIVGKNIITVDVTAEDGTPAKYVINVTREREALNVQTIKIFYIDEEGNRHDLVFTPEFNPEVFEYSLSNLPDSISSVNVDVLTNLEEAKISITGNQNITEGLNTITITAMMPSESEEEENEELTYTFKVTKEKKAEITAVGKIKNWFNANVNKILIGALLLCVIALAGLSVYIVIDYKRYKKILEKVAEITNMNRESINLEEAVTNSNEIAMDNTVDDDEVEETKIISENARNKGRHF